MTPTHLRAIRASHNLSTRALASLLRIGDERTIRRWQAGDNPVSGPASIVLEMLEAGELPERYVGVVKRGGQSND